MIHLLTPGSACSAPSCSGDHICHLARRRMMGIINLATPLRPTPLRRTRPEPWASDDSSARPR